MDRPSAPPVTDARTIDVRTLPAPTLRELVAVLSPKGPALLAAPDRFAVRERVLLAFAPVGLFAVVALAARSFGAACEPQQEASWALVYALPVVPLALVVVRAAQSWLRARRMPFAPGVYVLDRDLVIAHGPEIRVVPLRALAGISAPKRLPLGGLAEIALWIEGEPAESCVVPALAAQELVDRVEQARDAALADDGQQVSRRRHDALSELKRSSAWDRTAGARPRGDWASAIALAVPIALALGVGAMLVRNVASDAVALRAATASSDLEALECYAEAGGANAAAVRADVLPRTAYRIATEAGDAAALGQYVERFPDGPDTAAARERWIAMEYAQARESAWSLRAFVARFPDAPQATEARAALPRLALAEARRTDAADAYIYVIHQYPGTPEAEEAARRRHARYEAALASLLARGGREEAASFLRVLFAYLEAHDGPQVLVRFRTPMSDALRRFDALVSEGQNERVEPIAPSFSRRLSEQREALVFDRLNAALEPLVPRDVLRIARGGNLPAIPTEEEIETRLAELPPELTEEERAAERARILEHAERDSGEPEIRIDYAIVPTGDVYVTSTPVLPAYDDVFGAGGVMRRAPEPDRRRFAAFVIAFEIEMRVPGSEERHSFTIEVQPDAHVSVDGGEAAPTDATIYEVLATSAFDRLAVGLESALLGHAGE